MMEVFIGDVHLKSDGDSLIIARRDQPDIITTLDADGVKELISFVTSLATSEFNRRRTFRVPVHESSGLTVHIRKDENQLAVTARDISLTGIFVELSADELLELPQDSEVDVTLVLDGETQTHGGVVRRRQGNGYGLSFPESTKAGPIDPPTELSRLVMELQRRWMNRRAHQGLRTT